ncbi:MAG: hypothetical protein JRE64_06380 [Deltaproteobacteria bacterium]|nr:hypothetical protein [Deltaproteobacteria bacterium]
MRKIFFISTLIILTVFFSKSTFAKSVISTGVGVTCRAAQQDAIRGAVEQVVGAKLKSNTSVTDFQVDYDKIISSTDGLVNGYKELDVSTGEGQCTVVLKVEVNEKSTKQVIDKYITNKTSMRTFNQTNFSNRSVMVLYSTRGLSDAVSKNNRAAMSIIDDIQDKLRGYEFDVILGEDIEGGSKITLEDDAIDDEAAIMIARMAKADAIVLVTLLAGVRPTPDGYNSIYSNAMIKAYDPTTKRLFANVNERSKTIGRKGSYGVEDSISRAALKVSQAAVPELVKKIVQNLSTGSKKIVSITLQDVDPSTQDNIVDMLSSAGIYYKIDKQYGSIMKLSINTEMSATEFVKTFRQLYKQNGIFLKRKSTDGSHVVFSGKAY